MNSNLCIIHYSMFMYDAQSRCVQVRICFWNRSLCVWWYLTFFHSPLANENYHARAIYFQLLFKKMVLFVLLSNVSLPIEFSLVISVVSRWKTANGFVAMAEQKKVKKNIYYKLITFVLCRNIWFNKWHSLHRFSWWMN